MADTIKIGNLDISAFKVGSGDCKVYIGDTLLYPQGQPSFQGKWKATYSDSSVTSAECDSSSAITSGEINKTNLESVEIGNCVTSIGESAFKFCTSLTSIDIPDSVTSIDFEAFRGCTSLTSINIPSGVTTIADIAFSQCSGLTSVTIGNGVTSIGRSAFQNCSSLTSITVNATTPPTLGNNAFNGTNDCPIYVPSQSVSAYQSASRWSTYASKIQAIPNS